MTAPAQPPDPRVQRIADALTIWKYTVATDQADQKFARVLVEELGGREASVQGDGKPRTIWRQVMDALEVESNGDAVKKALALRAQQRENAETIKALTERAEVAERATAELDAQRKSAEQSARDLRENNATLRAELDAIKGAQREVRWTDSHNRSCVCTFDGVRWHVSTNGKAAMSYETVDSMIDHWPSAEPHRVALEALRHPAPALPVVGACVKTSRYTLTWLADKNQNQQECERLALNEVAGYGGVAYRLYRDVTPLTTEGGR